MNEKYNLTYNLAFSFSVGLQLIFLFITTIVIVEGNGVIINWKSLVHRILELSTANHK